MITSIIINGCLHIAEVRYPKPLLSNRRVCRIFLPWEIRKPKMVLTEHIGGTGIYSDHSEGVRVKIHANFMTEQIPNEIQVIHRHLAQKAI